MYIVIDKQTKEIIHINPAPLEQNLTGKDVYFNFDAETMLIGAADIFQVPEHFKITSEGVLREFTLQEKHDAGLITLNPMEKIVDDQLVSKTLSEQVADGILTLEPEEKIVGEGEEENIVLKSLSERVADGTIELAPEEKIIGEGVDEQIVAKTPSEQVNEGLLELTPTQKIVEKAGLERVVEKLLSEQVAEGILELDSTEKIVGEGYGEEIVEKSRQELLTEGLITLEDVREEAIQKLRKEVAAYYEQHKTANGYRLDQLARQKVNFSYQFRQVSDKDQSKQLLLGKRLIYPNYILDEILEEVGHVQDAYGKALEAIKKAHTEKQSVNSFEAISLKDFLIISDS